MEKILLIDDDEGLIHFLSRFFQRKGYEVAVCLNGRSAIEKISETSFDLILLDYKMPDLNGLDTLKKIKTSQVKTPVIIMTAYGNTDLAIEAMKRGAYDYLVKPFEREELSRVVSEALLVNRQMKEIVSFPDSAQPFLTPPSKDALKMIGRSSRMQDVYKLIGQIAEKNVSVLITGESGTGKEMAARAIYHHSRRKDKPFIAVNCAAIPETLFESELFGYERGAFTGAERTYIGKIERCNGGTVFLDEIADMPLSLQAKLLRVIQEGEFERLGGSQTILVNVRIIAATNKDLEIEIEQGRFRKDLYWRLKVISIIMPPLRNRTEDIKELVEYFLARFGVEYIKPVKHISEAAMAKIHSYSWPGNVRELENCIRRAILLCKGDIISEDLILLSEITDQNMLQALDREHLIGKLKDKLEEIIPEILRLSEQQAHSNVIEIVEDTLIEKALRLCGNNQVRAAKMLGISRNTLRHRLKRFTEKQDDSEQD
ncbi:Acetoacetate metabolism regulatory protein AtoC [uncultured Desulfobacterium sp.]|uniref:Acetoacetate metabolism regulatory protein AtoC n=1 Tax=uncultured Desulfobacterium sp. TaxID=201089 RepID=A0A445N1Q0_9BACT|nr:Acetoacetate metabolism regulatory protein AtoC [uncultured Desulfobacterium sp.]